MEISSNLNSYGNNYSCKKPNFKAIPRADYKKIKCTISELEKSDVNFLERIAKNIGEFFKQHEIEDASRKQVVEEAVNASIEILKETKCPQGKTKIFMAFSEDGKPSGIIIGNVPKVDKNGKVHYSSRKNHGKNETELDWLAAWNKKLRSVGKALTNELYISNLKDKTIGKMFVSSEVPWMSKAEEAYRYVGFRNLTKDARALKRANDNNCIIGQYDVADDLIMPMIVNKKRMTDAVNLMSKDYGRQEYIKPESIKLV